MAAAGETPESGTEVSDEIGRQCSDTESESTPENVESNVEPDSLVFSLPCHKALAGSNPLTPPFDVGNSETIDTSLPSSVPSENPSQKISDAYDNFTFHANAFYHSAIYGVAELEQELELLRLKEKDLCQQVKCLKEENEQLRVVKSDAVAEDVEEMQRKLILAVDRMNEYKCRCDQLEEEQFAGRMLLPGTDWYHHDLDSGSDTVEPDSMPRYRHLSSAEETLTPRNRRLSSTEETMIPKLYVNVQTQTESYLNEWLDLGQDCGASALMMKPDDQ